jgi:NAD-dependent oxidoreductase involved in siderophore biosynthesis
MGRFPAGIDSESACDIVRSTLSGGVGDDVAEVLRAEHGYDDGKWSDYSDC